MLLTLDLNKARKLHGRLEFQGLQISIENRKGSKRYWHDESTGERGATTMLYPYGYVRGTEGTDGDHVDVFVGPNKTVKRVFVITQMKKPKFDEVDEFKCMLGFRSAATAKRAYLRHYNDRRFFGAMKALSMRDFHRWVFSSRPARTELLKSLRDRLLSDSDSSFGKQRFVMSKAALGAERPGHLYSKRWRGTKGDWEYEYARAFAPSHKELITDETVKSYRKQFKALLGEYEKLDTPSYDAHWNALKEAGEAGNVGETQKRLDAEIASFRTEALTLKSRFTNLAENVDSLADRMLPGATKAERWKQAPALMSAIHTFRTRVSESFPEVWDSETDKRLVSFDIIGKDRAKLAASAKRRAYSALLELSKYIAASRIQIEAPRRETIEHRGVKISISAHSEKIRNEVSLDDPNSPLQAFLGDIDLLKSKLTRRGMEKLLGDGLTIELADRAENRSIWVAGSYNIEKDRLFVFQLGLAHTKASTSSLYSTAIHELGHRLYFRYMPSQARTAWQAAFDSKYQAVTYDDVEIALELWNKAKQQAEENPGATVYTELERGGYPHSYTAVADEPDLAKKKVLSALMAMGYGADTRSTKELREILQSKFQREEDGDSGPPRDATPPWVVLDEPLSDYGETNAIEAFAEAFRLYVDQGPGALPPGWRTALEDAAAASGMHLKKADSSYLLSGGKWRLLKSLKPPGVGWGAIPGGKHGGFRRLRGANWEYWYPSGAPLHSTIQEKLQREAPGKGREVALSRAELTWVLANGQYGLVSAGRNVKLESGLSAEIFRVRHEKLRARLRAGGYKFTQVVGHYGELEDTFLVMAHEIQKTALKALGAEFNQDSVIYADHGRQEMHFTTGEHKGEHHRGAGYAEVPTATNTFTELRHPDGTKTKFLLDFDFDHFHKALLVALSLLKSTRPVGGGWGPIPKGRHGGLRRKGPSGYEYWYPEAQGTSKVVAKPKSTVSEEQFEAGEFDHDAANWGWHYAMPGQPAIGWTKGGVEPESKHPVKEAGLPHRLFQIVTPHAEPGWAKLKDVRTGEERLVAHDRVLPVVYKPRTQEEESGDEEGGSWTPGEGIGKQASPTDVSGEAQRIPAFAQSQAAEGTALAKIEGGQFLRKTVAQFERDEGGESVSIKTHRTEVDNTTKTKLVAEFQGLIANQARDAQRKFGLPSDSLEDLRMAAVEGFLTAIEHYPGGLSFAKHAQFYTRDFARLQAATLFSGNVTLPARTSRLVSKYMAARAQASRTLHVMDPGPDEVAPFWNVKKRDIHNLSPTDPHRSDALSLGGYRLGEDTKEQAGKAEWAARIHEFLAGRATAADSEFFESPDAALPGVGVGHGISDTDKAEIRQAVARSIEDLKEHEITVDDTSYRANTGEILKRVLGLNATGEGQSHRQIASEVVIERKLDGEWRKLGDRQKARILDEFIQRGLEHARKNLGEDAGRFVGRAAQKFAPAPEAKRGPTYKQLLEARSRSVTAEDTRAWRLQARSKWKDNKEAIRHINRMGDREVQLRIAHERILRSPLSPEMHKLMTQTVSMEPSTRNAEYGSGTMTLTDPTSGSQRQVRIRTLHDIRPRPVGALAKAEETPTTGMLWAALHFPKLTQLYFSESAPTTDRYILETLMGIH